jgi:hypothetical protein
VSGRRVAISANARNGSLLLDLEHPWRRTWLKPHWDVYDVAVSPDGKLAATAGGEGRPFRERVKVWDTASGRIKAEIPGVSCVAFSADGQWMGVDDKTSYRFYRTDTWSPVSRLGYEAEMMPAQGLMRIAFHPVGNIVAILGGDLSTVRLADVRTGRVLASIEGPIESQVHRLVFSRDGRFLAVSHNSQKVDIWDLSLIYRRLQELDLADGFPDIFSGETPGGDHPTIGRLEVKGVDPAELRLLSARHTLHEAGLAFRGMLDVSLIDVEELGARAYRWQRLGQWQMAVKDFRGSLERDPNSALAANELAWTLACQPGRGDAHEAVRWAKRALELERANFDYRNTLGAALYRAGRYADAAVELERNIASNPPMIGYDWVFLAMCKQGLGLAAEARFAFDQATKWRIEKTRAQSSQVTEYHDLLHEARARLDSPLPDFPSRVFAH